MTTEQANLLGHAVFTLTPAQVPLHLQAAREAGRTAEVFTETVAGFVLFRLAVGPRPEHGEIARAVKADRRCQEATP